MDSDGATPLHHAIANNRTSVVKYLLEHHANPNTPKKNGVTPLHIAATVKNPEVIELLVAAKADVSRVDETGRTPLSIALEKQYADIAKILLEHSAACGKPSLIEDAPASIVFPKSHVPSKSLIHVNLLKAPMDTRMALTVLQGLVNREQPRIYISQDPGWHTSDLIPKWMDGIEKKGYTFIDIENPLDLFTVFRRNIKGVALYESDIANNTSALHKLNALTLFCSLNDAIPVTPELNLKLKLPVLLDARGILNTPAEAYEWAHKELWPYANHNVLAFTCPTHVVLRDYLVENRIMPFWISKDMNAEDEAVCMRFLDEAAPNSPVMGCWGGYAEVPAGRIDESTLQRITSERGKFMVVSDGCFDLSVHSGLKFVMTGTNKPKSFPVYDWNKVYLCLNFTDGDNLQYIQQYFCTSQWWGNPERGRVPSSWSINPSSIDLIPDILQYLLASQTPNDEIIASTAGIGIISPSLYANKYPERETIYNRYLALTGQAMNMTGLSIIHLGDTSGIPWTRNDFDYWALKIPYLTGILGDYGQIGGIDETNARFMSADRVPTVRVLNTPSSSASSDELVANIKKATPKQRPAFMHVSLTCWFNSPSLLVEAINKLGPEYVPVTPSNFFHIMTMPVSTRLWYDFTDDAEGWGNAFDMKDMKVSDGLLSATICGSDPYWIRGKTKIAAGSVNKVTIRLRVGKGGGTGQFFFITDNSGIWDEKKCMSFQLIDDGDWHEYTVPVTDNPEWKGTIIGIRLDPACEKPDIPVSVDYIHGE